MMDQGKEIKGCMALIITPTRELANQILKHFEMIIKHFPKRYLKIA